jgi:thioredoxin reductase
MHRYDVAIVGGGPAGLSAAVVRGRCRRTVVVFDHGRPRNYAAQAVHGYLGLDGIAPDTLRAAGRREALAYGAELVDAEVTDIRPCGAEGREFEITAEGEPLRVARKLLLATGVRDELPDVAGLREFYGKTVHHCPYCDGWEHRDRRLAALGAGEAAVGLALSLRTWSPHVTACSNGQRLSAADRQRATRNGIAIREEAVRQLAGARGRLEAVHFVGGPALPCDALFFAAAQGQRSPLPLMLGCECDQDGLIATRGKQGSGVCGLFLAGDADGDVQFAIVAAAEGATAATAINRELQDEDRGEPRDQHAVPLARAAQTPRSRD